MLRGEKARKSKLKKNENAESVETSEIWYNQLANAINLLLTPHLMMCLLCANNDNNAATPIYSHFCGV